jgi:hypothetical protein
MILLYVTAYIIAGILAYKFTKRVMQPIKDEWTWFDVFLYGITSILVPPAAAFASLVTWAANYEPKSKPPKWL